MLEDVARSLIASTLNMGVPKIRGTLFWGPYSKDPTNSGYYTRVPYFRKLPYRLVLYGGSIQHKPASNPELAEDRPLGASRELKLKPQPSNPNIWGLKNQTRVLGPMIL